LKKEDNPLNSLKYFNMASCWNGRQSGLKIQWDLLPWRFESARGYHTKNNHKNRFQNKVKKINEILEKFKIEICKRKKLK
jgi:hypothetical protein